MGGEGGGCWGGKEKGESKQKAPNHVSVSDATREALIEAQTSGKGREGRRSRACSRTLTTSLHLGMAASSSMSTLKEEGRRRTPLLLRVSNRSRVCRYRREWARRRTAQSSPPGEGREGWRGRREGMAGGEA